MTQEQAIERVGKAAERALKDTVYHGTRLLWGDNYHTVKEQLDYALASRIGGRSLCNRVDGYFCHFATVHRIEAIQNGVRMMYQVTFVCTIDGEQEVLTAENTIEARGKSKRA